MKETDVEFLQQLKDIESKMTPGEWESYAASMVVVFGAGGRCICEMSAAPKTRIMEHVGISCRTVHDPYVQENLAGIVALRNGFKRLVSLAEAARQQTEREAAIAKVLRANEWDVDSCCGNVACIGDPERGHDDDCWMGITLLSLADPPSAPVLQNYDYEQENYKGAVNAPAVLPEGQPHAPNCNSRLFKIPRGKCDCKPISETPEGQPQKTEITRFEEFDDNDHPFRIWWEKHGQFMLSGGGRRESIWAARGWIAREQLKCGVEVTGDSLHEKRPISDTSGEAQAFSRDSISREMFDCGYDNLDRAVSRNIVDRRYEQLLRAARPTETTQEPS